MDIRSKLSTGIQRFDEFRPQKQGGKYMKNHADRLPQLQDKQQPSLSDKTYSKRNNFQNATLHEL